MELVATSIWIRSLSEFSSSRRARLDTNSPTWTLGVQPRDRPRFPQRPAVHSHRKCRSTEDHSAGHGLTAHSRRWPLARCKSSTSCRKTLPANRRDPLRLHMRRFARLVLAVLTLSSSLSALHGCGGGSGGSNPNGPGSAVSFSVKGPATISVGSSFSFTVTAL